MNHAISSVTATSSSVAEVQCVANDVCHPTFSDDFNSSCPIPAILGTVITEWMCHQKLRKVCYFDVILIHTVC